MKLLGWLKGRKTIWVARAYVLAGLLLQMEPVIDTHLPGLQYMFPSFGYWPVVLMGTGVLFELLRWVTDGPVHYRESYRERDRAC